MRNNEEELYSTEDVVEDLPISSTEEEIKQEPVVVKNYDSGMVDVFRIMKSSQTSKLPFLLPTLTNTYAKEIFVKYSDTKKYFVDKDGKTPDYEELADTIEATSETHNEKFVNYKDMRGSLLKDGNYHNDFKLKDSGKSLNNSSVKLKKTDDKDLNLKQLINVFKSANGLGRTQKIYLWNSGFYVVIEPPKDSDLLALQYTIGNTLIHLGNETHNMIETNLSIVIIDTTIDFILNHVVTSNLKPEGDKDLKTAIKECLLLPDYDLLLNGFVNTMYPDGYAVTRVCRNYFELDNEGNRSCDFNTIALQDLNLMVYRDHTNINSEMIDIINSSTLTLADIERYQSLNVRTRSKELELITEDGTRNVLTISTPKVSKATEVGNIWVNNIIKQSLELFQDADNDVTKNQKVQKLLFSNYLGVYNGYFERLVTYSEDGEVLLDITDNTAITALMELASTDNSILNKLTVEMKDYIDKNSLAVIGTPSFTCPACEAKNSKSEKAYDDIIPLNMTEAFFTLVSIRMIRTMA